MNIVEASTTPRVLYHGTSMTGLIGIADNDELGAYGGEDQASLTRSFEVAKRFASGKFTYHTWGQLMQYSDFHNAMNNQSLQSEKDENGHDIYNYLAARAENAGGRGGVVLVLDWDKLAANHKVEPFDTVGDDSEEEEAVFNDIGSLSQYILKIAMDWNGFRNYCDLVLSEGSEEDRRKITKALTWVEIFSH